jgi:hyperosmotically inducible periplasmic protein
MKPLVIPLALLMLTAGCNQPTSTTKADNTYDKKGTTTTTQTDRKDNTDVNKRDRVADAKTPIAQNENQKDIDTTASIRKQVVNSDLSTNAKNSKIITQDGKVTLRGPVASDDEKTKIEEIAVSVAGSGNVDNLLEVQP